MKVRVGTRGSNLAMIQTNMAVELLKKMNPRTEFEIAVIKTKGDLVTDVPLHKMDDKGIFVKEIEQALLSKDIDLAVHSMKDMPSEMTQGLCFGAVQKGEDPRDVLVSPRNVKNLGDLSGLLIGTGSKRREFQLRELVADVRVTGIRGNIETRMKKIETEKLDGVVLAAAGLLRAGYEDRISMYFDPQVFVPSPCQGILALQIRESDNDMHELLLSAEDKETALRAQAERAYLKAVGGGCHYPVGAYSHIEGQVMTLTVLYGDMEGKYLIRLSDKANVREAEQLGLSLADAAKEAAYSYEG